MLEKKDTTTSQFLLRWPSFSFIYSYQEVSAKMTEESKHNRTYIAETFRACRETNEFTSTKLPTPRSI
jgi:hypothetical protein